MKKKKKKARKCSPLKDPAWGEDRRGMAPQQAAVVPKLALRSYM